MRDHLAFVGAGALALSAILSAACDDESCDEAEACDELGELRCAPGDGALEECRGDACGRQVWVVAEHAGTVAVRITPVG